MRDGSCAVLQDMNLLHRLTSPTAILELTHNHGTESDPNFAGYSSGNTEPGRGFGHIAITVPDIEAACARFESLGCNFKKRLTDGKMKYVLVQYLRYWVEGADMSIGTLRSCWTRMGKIRIERVERTLTGMCGAVAATGLR